MKRSARVRAGAAALLLLVFAAGGAVGAAVTRLRTPSADVSDRTLITIQAPLGIPKELMDLHPDATQQRVIDSVLAQSRPKVEAILRSMAPRLRAIVDSADREVQSVLTAAQQARLRQSRRAREPIFLLQEPDSGRSRVDTLRSRP